MSTKIFFNLPVKNLNKTVDFFTSLGFKFDPRFTDENATCMIISEENYAMLLVEKYFKTFTSKEVVDAHKSTETIIALSADSRENVDELADKALQAGGKISRAPEDHGWMYGRSFEDLEGHIWEG